MIKYQHNSASERTINMVKKSSKEYLLGSVAFVSVENMTSSKRTTRDANKKKNPRPLDMSLYGIDVLNKVKALKIPKAVSRFIESSTNFLKGRKRLMLDRFKA